MKLEDLDKIVREASLNEYIATFRPKLVSLLLAEVVAARENCSYPANRLPTNEEIGEGYRARSRYDKAREALDSELGRG